MWPRLVQCRLRSEGGLQVKIVVHGPEESGFWAEAPALPGCISQGESGPVAPECPRADIGIVRHLAGDRVRRAQSAQRHMMSGW